MFLYCTSFVNCKLTQTNRTHNIYNEYIYYIYPFLLKTEINFDDFKFERFHDFEMNDSGLRLLGVFIMPPAELLGPESPALYSWELKE